MSGVYPWRSPWGEALIYGGLLLPLPLAHKMAETVGYNRTGFSWGFVCTSAILPLVQLQLLFNHLEINSHGTR
ncbi:hypothetical protein [Synechocystis sp. LEGE 06083]|uniref:hypothetical protein n=1 Tax=Synechocystis sp. LEGE 06083 TaxID=915336 RepID=UPI00187F5826|nr:hypothetical protein [Synechocystis sp. LEGE 06083]